MNIKELQEKRNYINERKGIILDEIIEDFLCCYKTSTGAKDEKRITNKIEAMKYIKEQIEQKKKIDEFLGKDIHYILMKGEIVGGIYRNNCITISNTDYIPPRPEIAYQDIKYYYYLLKNKSSENIIELAAFTHNEFVKIHPFQDGNGRTARTLMNYQLIQNGYYPIAIPKEKRCEYIKTIEEYQLRNITNDFEEMIYKLEDEKLDSEIKKIN